MSNFDKAIKIIMAEPPEPRYPAYFADLLGKADVPDKDVGECSEIPNSIEDINTSDISPIEPKIRKLTPRYEIDRPVGQWIDYEEDGYVECPCCGSATNCDGNRKELHYCFYCGSRLE